MKNHELHHLEKHLLRHIGQLNREYNLIRPGDRLLIGISGGKDSLSCAALLRALQKRAPFVFHLEGVTLDTGIPADVGERLHAYMDSLEIPYEIRATNINSTIEKVVTDPKQICTACARFRRGILYDLAFEKRALLVLGHHADDSMETLLMNVFFTGKLQAMPPVLVSDDRRNRLIRPMITCREAAIRRYAELIVAPVTRCWCLAGCDLSNGQRARTKRLIAAMEAEYPDTGRHLLAATANCKPSNLMDAALWDFAHLRADWEVEHPDAVKPAVRAKWNGDAAFGPGPAASGQESDD
ncbi:tRNA 2-thiocytidine(32) synthetase TtcA [Myxococcota bacterium]|nr:tRNA 2-thiocytidine(32) synthetase TtcA [Myxococcota bacterium]